MAIQPIKFLVSPSATATNGSKTITVTGNIDCSYIYSGTAIALGTRQVVEAVSGTKPDGSGNSTITLRDNWADPSTTAKLIAFNTIEGLAEAIRRAREVVQASEAALSGNISYMGDHSAATGNFPEAPGSGLGSHIYRISVAGTIESRAYAVGELIYYDQYLSQWRSFYEGLGNAASKNVTESRTDTTAGRLLQVGDFGNGISITLSAQNLNTITTNGAYYCLSCTNRPAGENGYLTVVSLSSLYVKQTYTAVNSGFIHERVLINGVWQPWRLVFTQATILGAVSQSAGVPTGAIVERGSNANGEFVRFADGKQDCLIKTAILTRIAANRIGYTWTYPAAFISSTAITGYSISGSGSDATDMAILNTSVFYRTAASTLQGGIAFVISTDSPTMELRNTFLFATGRWY